MTNKGGRPKKDKEPYKVLSWKVEPALVELFDLVHAERKDRSKVDTLRALLDKEAKRLKIQLPDKPDTDAKG